MPELKQISNEQERLQNVTKQKENINNHKIVKLVIHLENGTQEVIRRGIDGNYDTWLSIIKPFLIAAICRVIQRLRLNAKKAA